MSARKLNIKLLRKIQKHILSVPARLVMDSVSEKYAPGTEIYDSGAKLRVPECGTVACIAGWACILSGEAYEAMGRAEVLLGLETPQSDRLFISDWWPKKYATRWGRAKTPQTRAKIAVERIDHLIATKGAE